MNLKVAKSKLQVKNLFGIPQTHSKLQPHDLIIFLIHQMPTAYLTSYRMTCIDGMLLELSATYIALVLLSVHHQTSIASSTVQKIEPGRRKRSCFGSLVRWGRLKMSWCCWRGRRRAKIRVRVCNRYMVLRFEEPRRDLSEFCSVSSMDIHVASKCLSRSKLSPTEAASVVLGRPWDQPSFVILVMIHDDSVVTISVFSFFLSCASVAETCQMCPLHILQQMVIECWWWMMMILPCMI